MVRFISAPILYCMVSTVLVPISAEAQDFKRSLWLHSALAQATETRQAPFSVSLAPGLNSLIGNAAMAGIGLSVVGALALGQTDQVSGAGGSLSQNALPTGDYRDTTQGVYGTEYRYNANLAQLNVLPLNNYGYDGTGINVALVDSGIDASHPEFRNLTIRGYVSLSGTSMAAPFVSGLAAALMEKFPNLTPAQIATRIKTTASLAPLTGALGETLANDGTAAMEAIFGHGLVDSGAAAAQIGNLTYALGPDVSRGQDLSQSKLALPAGVGRDLAKQIMADDFVVFDSFDNAMFTVSGSQVFGAAAAGFVPSYGAGSATIDAIGGSVKARRALQSQPKEQLIFSFLQQGDTPITADYWQGMAALFAPQPFVVPAAKLRMSWESRQGSISSLMPFLSFGSGALGQGSDRSLEIGLASKVRLGGAIDLISSISVGEQAINFGLDDQSDLIGLVKAEFGVNATLNAANRFFLRYEQSRYSDRAATESDFGMSAARADSWMMGVETQLPEADLTVGVRNDYALSQGTVSLMTPASMLKDGTILYDHKSYGLDRSVRLRPFVAVQHDTYGGTLNFGARFGSWDRSDLEGVELSFSRQF